MASSAGGAAAAALPRTTLLDLQAVLLQSMAELMVGGDCAAFARSCTACRAAAAGAVHAVVLNEVARRLKAGKRVGDAICTKCPTLVVPAGVTSIGDFAFEDCTSLTSIVLPAGLKSVGDQVFFSCTSSPLPAVV